MFQQSPDSFTWVLAPPPLTLLLTCRPGLCPPTWMTCLYLPCSLVIKSRTSPDIVVGQLLGIGTLIALSLAGSMLGSIFDPRYIGLLGLFPLYLGGKGMLSLWRPAINDVSESNPDLSQKKSLFRCGRCHHRQWRRQHRHLWPLFCHPQAANKISTVVVFMLMTLLWCAAAHYLAKTPVARAHQPVWTLGHAPGVDAS